MSADEHAIGTIRVPGHDQVLDVHGLARAAVANLEGLAGNRGPGLTEVVRQQHPLPVHRRRTAGPWPQFTDRLEMGEGPGARKLRLGRDGTAGHACSGKEDDQRAEAVHGSRCGHGT